MKKTVLPVSFFFGANNKAGYCSLFDTLYDPCSEGKHLILKGGPGTGKSTLMKELPKKPRKKAITLNGDFAVPIPIPLMLYWFRKSIFPYMTVRHPTPLTPLCRASANI